MGFIIRSDLPMTFIEKITKKLFKVKVHLEALRDSCCGDKKEEDSDLDVLNHQGLENLPEDRGLGLENDRDRSVESEGSGEGAGRCGRLQEASQCGTPTSIDCHK